MKTVIIAGGLGTRLQPYTTFLPKPMLPLGEKPILEHLIEWSKKNGIKSIVLCVSYLRKSIENYFEDGKKFGVSIEYAVSTRPLATAGQLKTAEKFIDDTFVCMYGDSIYGFNLRNMIKQHNQTKSFVTMSLKEYKTKLPYGVIETTKNNRITAWKEKPEIKANINIGCYVMEPEIFKLIPKDRPYGMDSVIKNAMSKKKVISSFISKNEFIDIGDKESYERANKEFIQKLGNI
ncbi:MAG TPA: nucleotidyltransferase family protein [Nitrosopumilaceae archaeon]|nr:nucleotidyltransferase family protein [Nitrosopumilaceae archaeon]